MVGLIINKPSKIKVRDVFPDSPALQKIDAMAYFGGPVDADVVARSAIFRSKTPPKDATLVFGDVYVSFDSDTIAASAGTQQAATLRVFLGRAQWDPVQFENEVARGSWHSSPASVDSIFSAFPENLWRALIDKAEPRPVVQNVPPLVPRGNTSQGCSWERHSPEWRFSRPTNPFNATQPGLAAGRGQPVRTPCGSTPPRGGGGAS